ncbi:protein translocase subunit SecF [Nocardioides donggukensis]|uniref:Protein-export membrane protein SecF n=1 Tax=Nocardioides donggukensis TaxID=2774019 RepID=A0A927PZU8_9ACTN|nr:protein translocase subunit SecF [Nocardioides donggukensis]MBD8869775.1 protein translocase subunit SecF [Nocardioides donggukensis]
MSRFSRLGSALYEGEVSVDFVGRRRTWYAVSAVLIVIAMFGLFAKGLNFGIEFEGGTEYAVTLPADQVTQDTADRLREEIAALGIEDAEQPVVTTSGAEAILVQTESLELDEVDRVSAVIQEVTGATADDLSLSNIGASWGRDIIERAVLGLVVFLVLVVLFIWAYFREWKASVASLVALGHDVVITVGIYALSGFEVSPATVTGLLTILGFSLYDTVVVFDKVRENTADLRARRTTYARAANLAVNQTLVRSINTTVVALLPVAAILWVGVVQLGSGSLKDLALALFVGMAAGAYSSIFIATPLLVQLKSGEKEIRLAEKRAGSRRPRAGKAAQAPAKTGGTSGATSRPEPAPARPVRASASAKRTQPSRQTRAKRGKR